MSVASRLCLQTRGDDQRVHPHVDWQRAQTILVGHREQTNGHARLATRVSPYHRPRSSLANCWLVRMLWYGEDLAGMLWLYSGLVTTRRHKVWNAAIG